MYNKFKYSQKSQFPHVKYGDYASVCVNCSVHLHIFLTAGASPLQQMTVPLVWAEARAAVNRLRLLNASPV